MWQICFMCHPGKLCSMFRAKVIKFKRKLNFDQVSKQTQTENFNFLSFFKTNRSVEAYPKKIASILADSEYCERCGDFGT